MHGDRGPHYSFISEIVFTCNPFFFNFAPNHIFGIGEARHFKFRILIDREKYSCMHEILPQNRCAESHVTSLNKGIVAMEH